MSSGRGSYIPIVFFLSCMINILRQMKKFLVELIDRSYTLFYNTIFIDRYVDFDKSDKSIFFFLEKTVFDLLVFCSVERNSA